MSHATRRDFVFAVAGLPLGMSAIGNALAGGAKQYVCPPCGCASDGKLFANPGLCPSCGMALVANSGAAVQTGTSSTAWAGSFGAGGAETPIRITVSNGASGRAASLDLAGFAGDYNLHPFDWRDDGFAGVADAFGRRISIAVTTGKDAARGTATLSGKTYQLALQRIGSLDAQAVHRFEGAYVDGERVFLVEHIFGEILAMNEQPGGTARILFPVESGGFICGPSLFAPAPVWRRVHFDGDGENATLVIEENNARYTARRLPLRSEAVTFANGSVILSGTLVLPAAAGRHAAYVFTHGSGAATRTTFSGLGYYFAMHGIAALKYDKRGCGESTGSFATASFEDLADDAVAGARMLAERTDIDARRVGFWGLSQGSAIAPLAASRAFPEAPVIAASGGGVPIDVWELLDAEAQLRSDGRFSQADIARALQFERLRDTYKRDRTGWDAYAAARAEAVTTLWYNYPTTDLFGPSTPDSPGWQAESQFFFYDPAPALARLRGPFLGLYGENDPASSGARNVDGVRAALRTKRDITLRIVPKASHNLFESASANASELPRARRFAAGLFDGITDWALRHT